MQLQLALDFETREEAKRIIASTKDYVNIFEIGTCFLLKEGSGVIEEYRAMFPDITILADAKIMDAGYEETQLLLEAGADIVTVLACTDVSTLNNCIKCAKEYGKEIMMDLIAIEDIEGVKDKINLAGLDYVCAHRSVDKEIAGAKSGSADTSVLKALKDMGTKAKLAIAGGIRRDNLDKILIQKPDVVIMGRAITSAKDIAAETSIIRGMMDE